MGAIKSFFHHLLLFWYFTTTNKGKVYIFSLNNTLLGKVLIVIFGKMEMIHLTISWKTMSTISCREQQLNNQVNLFIGAASTMTTVTMTFKSRKSVHSRQECMLFPTQQKRINPLNAVSFPIYLTGTKRFSLVLFCFFFRFFFDSFLILLCFTLICFCFVLFVVYTLIVQCLFSHIAFIYTKRTSTFRKFRLLQ